MSLRPRKLVETGLLYSDKVSLTVVTRFEHFWWSAEDETTRTATIVIRGATQNHLDDVERAVDDGVNVVKAITRDPRLVPGAGATEMQLIERIVAYGEKTPGLLQHAIKKYGEAFEVIPRTLAESAGLDATEVLSRLYAAHHKRDNWNTGVDIEVWTHLYFLTYKQVIDVFDYRTRKELG